jgi:SAM-dependent methyltransferase
MSIMTDGKKAGHAEVRAHWEQEPCGTRGLESAERRAYFRELEEKRYAAEPHIREFARFERGRGLKVLEVGVGAGTDFVNWVRQGAVATGVDLTERGVELTRERLLLEGLEATVLRADAEALPFADDSFDIVYSHGVLHHSPDTERAIAEVRRVLRPGGTALIMIYHLRAWTTLMLWTVHALGKGKPWRGAREVVAKHLESPGTKAYTRSEARRLFAKFKNVRLDTRLGSGDLLLMPLSRTYDSALGRLAWSAYPRPLVRALGGRFGFFLFAEATK